MKPSISKILIIALPLAFGFNPLNAQAQLVCTTYMTEADCNEDSVCAWFDYGCQGSFTHECFLKSEQDCTGVCWWQGVQGGICFSKDSLSTKTDRK